MNNLLIVGGGPIGLNIAAQVADEGWSVDVIEEHPAVGKPVHCSGLISVSGCEDLNLDVKDVLINKIMGARIHSPDGQVMVNPFANPVLATAGTGDVLAGVIAGSWAQGQNSYNAAVAGTYLHGQAGAILAEELGVSGVVAGDLLAVLPKVIKKLKEN